MDRLRVLVEHTKVSYGLSRFQERADSVEPYRVPDEVERSPGTLFTVSWSDSHRVSFICAEVSTELTGSVSHSRRMEIPIHALQSLLLI